MMLHSKKRVTFNLRFPLKTFLLFLLLICLNLYWIPWIVRKFHIHDDSRPSVPFPVTLLDHSRQLHLEVPSSDLPVYYINRDADFIRRDFIRQQLRSWGFKDINRVSAWNTEDVQKYVKSEVTSIPNIMSQNEKEIACIASHLHAMLLAVEDTSNTSPYALIMEDDVSLEMQVDWLEMIEHAPKDFTILQLTTSNSEAVTKLWSEYVHALNIDAVRAPLNGSSLRGSLKEQAPILESELSPNPNHQWVLRKWDSAYWSTQAYLIHKQRIKERLFEYIQLNPEDHHYHIHLRKPDKSLFNCSPLQNLCVLPFRLVADIFLYTFFPPTYITRIPIFNGRSATPLAKSQGVPEISTISDDSKAKKHQIEFDRIETLIQGIQKELSHLLPRYFKIQKQ